MLARGVSYCLARHVKNENVKRSLMTASIRYLDTFTKQDGHGISLSAFLWWTGSIHVPYRRLLSRRIVPAIANSESVSPGSHLREVKLAENSIEGNSSFS
jgi:hypothetical protein